NKLKSIRSSNKKINIAAIILVGILIVTSFVAVATMDTYTPSLNYTIVIDAGHGGIDGGVVGLTTRTKESVTNLQIANKLKEQLRKYGVNVVMTRTGEEGLYKATDGNKKRADMRARKKIINDCQADMVVSIHINHYPQSTRRGAQVFFQKGDGASRQLATVVQDKLNQLSGYKYCQLAGDYYILQCINNPSVIVECGFFSNAADEQLLLSDDYQQRLSEVICDGIICYMYLT
ncbi:MAG: N-acetylmuramoyl-L-alanine amidase, partial [Clostridia bacterium]